MSKTTSQSHDEGNETPKALDTVKSAGGLAVVGPDKLSIKYESRFNLHNVGAVQADRPAPSKHLLYYFEITVKNAGARGCIAIGLTTSNFNPRRQPGWDANTCGYHGDNGNLYRGHGWGEIFGPTFTTGDIVGAGINYATKVFFFTKNGVLIGSVKKDFEGPIFPTVGLHSPNEEVTVNFGNDPYAFDLKAYEKKHRAKQHRRTINGLLLPQDDTSYGEEDEIFSKWDDPPHGRASTNLMPELNNNASDLDNKVTSPINDVHELKMCIKDLKEIMGKTNPKEQQEKTKESVEKMKNFEKMKENNDFLRRMLFVSWIAFIVCFVVIIITFKVMLMLI